MAAHRTDMHDPGTIRWPPQCCCCNARPGNQRWSVLRVTGGLGVTVTWTGEVPICGPCLADLEGPIPSEAWRLPRALGIAAGILWILVIAIPKSPQILSILVVFLVLFGFIATVAALGSVIVVVFKPYWRRRGVVDVDTDGNLRFGNARYQQEFYALNPPTKG